MDSYLKAIKELIEWILSRKEGQILLSALMVIICIESYWILSLTGKNEKLYDKVQRCEQRNQVELRSAKEELKVANQQFLNYVIKENEEKQIILNKYDSLVFEVEKNK